MSHTEPVERGELFQLVVWQVTPPEVYETLRVMLQALEDQKSLWGACERTCSRIIAIRGVEAGESLTMGIDEHGERPLRRWTGRVVQTGYEFKAGAVDGLGIRRSEEPKFAP